MSKARFWTCQRVSAGQKCGMVNPKRLQICAKCKKRRPATKEPAHRAILKKMPYEEWVELYGEVCGICFRPPAPGKRLYRDHDHRTGRARGLTCFMCNRLLTTRIDNVEWLQAAIAYLERAERPIG